MSLLDTGNFTVTVYPQVTATDADGNTVTRPSATGQTARAASQVRTDAAGSEDLREGFGTVQTYRMRLTKADDERLGELGPQSRVEVLGDSFEVIGFRQLYAGSARTAHHDYILRRR